ncbi:MAG: pyridoxal phosphate-dependent aminotransferase [Candidatus Methanoperedens sp.]|jgi:aspartate aminotransferase|nr:pyridoxal phosphate-dependent aminotransferase [Candidatus Methanoperedens sp.]PKL54377.1 MAG: aspartate aminotransferase [Candidatus Methanoperedenaceae archaeon HGW-Methanoperedenaceae-1]
MTATRLKNIPESATIKMSNLANELKSQGKDVINFSLGEPDFNTPKHIIDEAKASIDRGETHYTPSAGIPELREAIAVKLKEENHIETKAKNIIVTPGAKQAIFEVMLSVLEEGDEAVLFDPAWVSYDPAIMLAGAKTVWAATRRDNGFSPVDVNEYITRKTKIIVVNSPCNPTGGVYDRATLKEIADIAVDKNIMVLSDEIYEKIIYDKEHISIGSMDGMEDMTITVNGFSKAYAMTGWRLGYVNIPKEIYENMMKLHSHSVSQATSFVQYAGVAALQGDQTCVTDMVREFRERRDLLVSGLNKLGIKCARPDGAFYAFADVSEYGTGDEVAELLLNKAYVAATSGGAFGNAGRDFLRISYATSQERIREALLRIEKVLG